MEANVLVDAGNKLGESIFWDPADGALWWTDIEDSSCFRLQPGQEPERFFMPGRVAFIQPASDGGFIVGFPKLIARATRDLTRFTTICSVETDIPQTRINDATVDPFGGIIFGTFDESFDSKARRPIASVYRLAPDRSLTCLFGSITVSNGLAFSPDGTIMYFADTAVGSIRRFRVGTDFSAFSEIEPLDDGTSAPGKPDGAVVDREGNYWSARVWGGCVACFSPAGEVIETVKTPAVAPTCPSLGGEDLRGLYVTSLLRRAGTQDDPDSPFAGGLFHATVKVPGLPPNLCRL